MVEAVDGGVALVAGEHIEHGALDSRALDLHEQGDAAAHELAQLGQRRNRHARRRLVAAELAERERRDRRPRRQSFVVMDDDHAVGGGVDVQLEAVRARVDRQLERRKGVFARQAGHAAMRDPQNP